MNPEQCWTAVTARDRSQDGRFLYGVVTTGVYCRPSCPSRLPLRKNVRFYADAAQARADGLRACKRCRPDGTVDAAAQRIHELCRHIERHAGEAMSLAALARLAHLSPFHLQRSFKAVTGMTPKQYVDACRIDALKAGLRSGQRVTEAIYDAGFGSASRVYERIDTRLGMTPAQYRGRGKDLGISYASARTPLGLLMMGATDRGLCFVQFGESEAALLAQLRAEYPGAKLAPMAAPRSEQFEAWMQALAQHLQGKTQQLELPLDVRGTAFQMSVWSYLQRIPYGSVQSYSEVAQGIGKPRAVRAVASACAANRVALVIPCHRVIRGDGALGGYRWGLERKRTLLDRERAAGAERS
ncbi:MAG TPA: bifunctional DNA-binding transcriptional regulator/O6-methylguanine-DNA methyltransferase Ada [Candidatus Binatia bacterium]|nr:bifunctional DNA-binding transcriptional regulator/O6-methylguanine-DNA methyltransferase Ada [Candidatus Binatia bacterium]